jgi:hypothetical protein
MVNKVIEKYKSVFNESYKVYGIKRHLLQQLSKEQHWDKFYDITDADFKNFEKQLSLDDIKELTGITFNTEKLEKQDVNEEKEVEKVIKEIFKQFQTVHNDDRIFGLAKKRKIKINY